MNQYNGLLSAVARQYGILRGTNEEESEWKTRLIYSICGMMAYASLWDDSEETVSIIHLKRKVKNILSNYKLLYPELSGSLPYKSEELENEIDNLFLSAGVVYHNLYRIAPSINREELFCGILFQRGVALDNISCVSGTGFYSKQQGEATYDGVKDMFGLETENLQALWNRTLSASSWKPTSAFTYNTEYLRLKPPFSRKYWVNEPDKNGVVSILRTGVKGSELYYLYRYTSKGLEASPLPHWMVESHNYRSLACACLSAYGTLPPIEYSEDGAIVHLHMNYLLPPRELEFLKLYSWPETCVSLPCNFRRKLSAEIFVAIRNILSDEGYEFTKG